MSRSDRKRSAKRDLEEMSRIPHGNKEGNDPRRSGGEDNDMKSIHNLEYASREPLPGSRGSHKYDSIHEGRGRHLKATAALERDESYGMKTSPGLDEWRQRSRSRSPKNTRSRPIRSRSRSRSPVRGYRRESGNFDRDKSRSGVSGQLCKDFASGRCRRGNHCPLLHQITENYKDTEERKHQKDGISKYPSPRETRDYPGRSGRSSEVCNNFLKGKCWRGESCRHVHDGASDGSDKGSATEVLRERVNDRYNKTASFDRGVERQTLRNGDTPCKFFAAGNCRSGRQCRFPHNGQARVSPDRMPGDDDKGHMRRDPDDGSQTWDGPKWTDTDAGNLNDEQNDKMSLHKSSGDVNQVWDGPKWSDTDTTHTAKLSEEKMVNMGFHEQSAATCSNDDRWASDPTVVHKPADRNEKEATRGNEQGTGDMEMSPDWNYTVQSANHLTKEKHGDGSQSLPLNIPSLSTLERNITQAAPVPNSAAAPANMMPMSGEKSFQQNKLPSEGKETFDKTAGSGIDLNRASTILPGQSFEQNGRVSNVYTDRLELYGEGHNANPLQVNPVTPQTQNAVTSEQLTQLTNISASLTKLLENGQELPKLYAALNPHNQLGTQGPFQTVSDSIDLEKPDINNIPSGFSQNPIAQSSSSVDVNPTIPANVGHPSKDSKLADTDVSFGVVSQNNGGGDGKSKKEPTNTDTQENGASKNAEKDGGIDEGKKSQDGKVIRAFKFALVEFVKELLKPSWKEGRIDKEIHKTIVKKVVDKVTGTIQGANIPQTQEKIELYLSLSKPKLTKLVQAYVEKFQKGKE